MFVIKKINPIVYAAVNNLIFKPTHTNFLVVRNVYRVAIIKEFGDPIVIQGVDVGPALKDDEVRVKVNYCSLNYNDVQLLSNKVKKAAICFPLTPGHEFSGEVLEVGCNNINNINVGDRIVAVNDLFGSVGALAEQTIAKNGECWVLPTEISLKDASVLPFSYGTALYAFSTMCPLKEHDVVLISVGPAGIGLAAIEIAVSVYKTKVIAICDTEGSQDLIREKGAHKTIKFDKNFTKLYKQIQDAIGEEKAVVAYDAVGNGILHVLSHFVDKRGKLISAQPFFKKKSFLEEKIEFELPKNKAKKKKKNTEEKVLDKDEDDDDENISSARLDLIQNVQYINLYLLEDKQIFRQMISDILTLCGEHIITGFISKTFNFSDIKAAIKFIETKQCTGKVLIDLLEQQPKELKDAEKDTKNKEKEKKSD